MSEDRQSLTIRLRRFWFAVIAAAVVLTGVPATVPPPALAVDPVIYWVDQATGNDVTGDGTEGAPFKTITKALELAGNVDTVMVGPGLYNVANGETFPLWFEGTSMQSTAGAAATVLESNETSRVALAEQCQQGDVISGFTFRNGAGGAGAGLTCYLSWGTGVDSPRIEDNVFEYNDAGDSSGGALYFFASSDVATRSPLVQRNVFRGNHGGGGGAIGVDSLGTSHISITIIDNEFRENTARSGGAIRIRTNGKRADIVGNTFGANETVYDGGAINISDSAPPEVPTTNVIVHGNRFSSNIARRNGGGLYLDGAHAQITANDGATSDAVEGGFGYLANSSWAIAFNNRIFGGSVDTSGSAWRVVDSVLGERNDTVAINSGLSALDAFGGTSQVFVYNCIYWNELPAWATGLPLIEIAYATTIDYSCLRDTAAADPSRGNGEVGAGVIFDDPAFVNVGAADARLSAASPCIDAADPAKAPGEDYFGTPRPLDGDGSGTPEPDMGYHEFVNTPPVTLAPVYRFYNAKAGVHFYTASEAEKASVIANLGHIYKLEGVSYQINTSNPVNSQSLHRFYNAKAGVHFYTASESEKNSVIANLGHIYKYEGVAYKVSVTPTAMPVWRFYNFKKGVHFYTASEAEKNSVVANLSWTYKLDGIGYHIGQ